MPFHPIPIKEITPMPKLRLVAFALLICSLIFANATTGHAKSITTDSEVIVIADVHGAYPELTTLLKELKLISSNLDWSGGKTHLVSLGDLVDRGKNSRKVIELMIKLDKQAEKVGGALHQVLGNHEIMLMTGDFRYVSDKEFNVFSDLETKADRDQLLIQYKEVFSGKKTDLKNSFNSTFPKGFMGLVRAYSPKGHLGRWLRSKGNTVLKVNENLHVHGGLSLDALKETLGSINKSGRDALADYDQAQEILSKHNILSWSTQNFNGLEHLIKLTNNNRLSRKPWYKAANQVLDAHSSILYSNTGPYWYRGNASCPEVFETYTVDFVLNHFDAKRIIIGHTPKYQRLVSRMKNRVIMADTGMLASYYQGTASAIISNSDDINAFHSQEKFKNTLHPETRQFIGNPEGMDDNRTEQFLRQASIIENKAIGTGITRSRVLQLEHNGVTMRAIFKTFDNAKGMQTRERLSKSKGLADRYIYEIAAYKLDRLLNQNLIPPVTLRTIDGKEGAIQLWIEETITENKRKDSKVEYVGSCSISNQTRIQTVFDTLIYNVDRNNGNLLWDKEFNLYLIDHSQTFGTPVNIPKMYRRSKIRLSSDYKEKLESLTEASMTKEIGEYLHPDQIKAVIARRDLLLQKNF